MTTSEYVTHAARYHDGVSQKYEYYWSAEMGSILLHYFMHVDGLSMDAALAKLDALDRYIREYRS